MLGRRRQPSTEADVPEPSQAPSRPTPPDGARNLVIVVLDSLRWDSWAAASMPVLDKLGQVERRWSYASWTAPSHFNLLMGLLPHASPTHVYASEYYKQDFIRYTERLGVPDMEFARLLPSLYLPSFLRDTLGYYTSAMVSMPVLNPKTPINVGFDRYQLMPSHNDMARMLDGLEFPADRPAFHLLNVGETHYPYAVPGEDPSEWPRISGVHGVLKHLSSDSPADAFFNDEQLTELRARQVRAATYLNDVIERLLDVVPPQTWVIVTSDHGELFGEGGYFGHGPIAHDKVFEVPFVEGLVRGRR
jgi:arylsulfatase A-like enzyme